MATEVTPPEAEDDVPCDLSGKPKKLRRVSGELAVMADISDLLDKLYGDEQFRVKQWFLSRCRAETEGK